MRPVLPLIALLLSTGAASAAPQMLKPGNPGRKLILDALRAPVEKDLKQKVLFRVDRLMTEQGWAFLLGVPQQAKGKPIDYRRTRYRDALNAGAFDDGICALLRRDKGRWRVVTFTIGATDVPNADWHRRYRAPASLFRKPRSKKGP
jgi:hypothetical protein